MSGVAGSGKTTSAKELEARGYVRISVGAATPARSRRAGEGSTALARAADVPRS